MSGAGGGRQAGLAGRAWRDAAAISIPPAPLNDSRAAQADLLLVAEAGGVVEARGRAAAVAAIRVHRRGLPAVPLAVRQAAQARGGGLQRPQGRVCGHAEQLPLSLEAHNKQDLRKEEEGQLGLRGWRALRCSRAPCRAAPRRGRAANGTHLRRPGHVPDRLPEPRVVHAEGSVTFHVIAAVGHVADNLGQSLQRLQSAA